MFNLTNAREKNNFVNLISDLKTFGFIGDGTPVDFLLSFLYCYSHYYYYISSAQYLVNVFSVGLIQKSIFSLYSRSM